MKEYSETTKARMVARLLPPRGVSATQLSAETGISQASLSRWLKAAAKIGPMPSKRQRGSGPDDRGERAPIERARPRTGEEKLAIVVQAAGLEGEELGEFLRREGVHLAELEQWRKLAQQVLQGEAQRVPPSKEMRKLKAELARKEKALAEAAVLLVLKKKAEAIWGDEDDDTDGTSES
jgi:transposase